VAKVEKEIQKITTPMTIAIMGCVVNGPGEAREADIGIAGGKGAGVLFRRGKIVRKVKEPEFASVLLKEIHQMASETLRSTKLQIPSTK
jgi:(E)-4-hydroxy-3-methylbut-2-enyl-diphosphate synthase